MPEASTSAAPADAGPQDGQVSQPDGNSAVDRHDTQRQDRGAAPSNLNPKPKQQTKSQPDEDPEWDLGNGKKAKRSEITKRLLDVQRGATKAAEEAKTHRERLAKLDAALKKHGLDPGALEDDEKASALLDKLSQERLAKRLEEASLEPSERERRELKAENERLKRLEQERAEEAQEQEHTKQIHATADQIAGRFATALQEHGLPVNPATVWRMAALAQGARKAGKQISLAELARMTDHAAKGDVLHYLPKGDVKALKALLGSDWPTWADAIRKDLLSEQESKFTVPQPSNQNTVPRRAGSTQKASSHQNGYYSLDEWNRTHGRGGR